MGQPSAVTWKDLKALAEWVTQRKNLDDLKTGLSLYYETAEELSKRARAILPVDECLAGFGPLPTWGEAPHWTWGVTSWDEHRVLLGNPIDGFHFEERTKEWWDG